MEERRNGIRRAATRTTLTLLAVVLLAGMTSPAYSCEPALSGESVGRLESNHYVLAYRARPEMSVGEYFTLDIAVCARNGTTPSSIEIDGHMPAHRHNMNYTPTIQRTAAGRWQAQGLLFHMPGRWELRFDVRGADGERERLVREFDLR